MENKLSIDESVQQKFNIKKLKSKQKKVINCILDGRDVVALLPTGYGKSMCYLVPPMINNKVVIIISPLISLMDDQKDKLLRKGIHVSCLHSNNKKIKMDLLNIYEGDIKIVYTSPEYFLNSGGIDMAINLDENDKLGFIAVDEAHCISTWGHDFRSEYLKLKCFKKLVPNIPIMAVTATATNEVFNDILKNLKLDNPEIIVSKLDRPNLYLECRSLDKLNSEYVFNSIAPLLKKYENEKIIIYTNSRKETSELAQSLTDMSDYTVGYYHAGLTKKTREQVHTAFNNGDINIIVSTVAFGMGIDQTVRLVIIIGAPSSIEDYYQQIGRAGRDGLDADTLLLYSYKQIKTSEYFLSKIKNPAVKKSREQNVSKVSRYFYTKTCRRKYILEHFGQVPDFFTCKMCDNCTKYNLNDYTNDLIRNIDILFEKNINKNKIDDELFFKKLCENGFILPSRNSGKYYATYDFTRYIKKINKYILDKNVKKIPDEMKFRLN